MQHFSTNLSFKQDTLIYTRNQLTIFFLNSNGISYGNNLFYHVTYLHTTKKKLKVICNRDNWCGFLFIGLEHECAENCDDELFAIGSNFAGIRGESIIRRRSKIWCSSFRTIGQKYASTFTRDRYNDTTRQWQTNRSNFTVKHLHSIEYSTDGR